MAAPTFSNRDMLVLLMVPAIIVAALAIGVEHLVIWLWHHVSVEWLPTPHEASPHGAAKVEG